MVPHLVLDAAEVDALDIADCVGKLEIVKGLENL